jgi:hypothetical protein
MGQMVCPVPTGQKVGSMRSQVHSHFALAPRTCTLDQTSLPQTDLGALAPNICQYMVARRVKACITSKHVGMPLPTHAAHSGHCSGAKDTVPTHSVRQSRVTGPQVETKGHGGHRSQRRLTNLGEPKASKKGNLDAFLAEISPWSQKFSRPDEENFSSGRSQVTPPDELIALVQYSGPGTCNNLWLIHTPKSYIMQADLQIVFISSCTQCSQPMGVRRKYLR